MTTKTRSVKATARLSKLHTAWRSSEQRFAMALQTLQGAQAAVLNDEVAFKAAARLKHGEAATFEVNPKNQLVFRVPRA